MTLKIYGSTPNQLGMFTFYIDGVATTHSFPLFIVKDRGVVLGILKGVTVNTVGNDLTVSPVYRPLFIFDRRPGTLRIETLGTRLTVSQRRPLLHVERVTREGDLE